LSRLVPKNVIYDLVRTGGCPYFVASALSSTEARPRRTNIGDKAFAGKAWVATRSEQMKTLWILAAAATLVACHNRAEDETGAAPDRGDTTAVAQPADTAMAAPADTSITPQVDTTTVPETGVDTTTTPPTEEYPSPSDTTAAPPSEQYPSPSDTTAQPGVTTDTTMAPSADTSGYSDPNAGAPVTPADSTVPDTSTQQP
jgi:hypothetical protein